MSRPSWDVAAELIANVTEGAFGEAFHSVCFADVVDPTEEAPAKLVIVAVGETAARLNAAYQEIVGEVV